MVAVKSHYRHGYNINGRYEGGPYIDVRIGGRPIDVINVYDYELGRVEDPLFSEIGEDPKLGFTITAEGRRILAGLLKEWSAEMTREDLDNYVLWG